MPKIRDFSSVIFWPYLAMVVLAPLPFGSIYPWSSTLIATFTGILLLGWAAQTAFGSARPAIGLKQAWPFVLPFLLLVAWIVIQMASWTPESWHHPFWKTAGEILGEKLPGRITLDAAESANGLMRLLTYGGVFWLALQYGRDSRNARRMIVSLAIAGFLYAAYGLAMEMSGANLILWYEKEWYFGSVTSVFHYKNSYATYASMGLICILGVFMTSIAEQSVSSFGKMETRRRVFTWLSEKGWVLILGLVTVASALVLTISRAGVICGGIGVITFVCQRRSKIRPVGRSKTRPLSVMRCSVLRVVPVVHRRDPRCFV